jgi:hypothetical protein
MVFLNLTETDSLILTQILHGLAGQTILFVIYNVTVGILLMILEIEVKLYLFLCN